MFARRHPFLFFCCIALCCITLIIIGFTWLAGSYARLAGESGFGRQSGAKGNIGVIEINGVILSSKKTLRHLKAFREDKSIKAIVIRIESPGGGIGPSQEIYREILKTRQKKKVLASMGAIAASGGYYIAAAADGIMANPGTLTGSIGVIMEYASLIRIAEKIGISPVIVKSGEYKDMGSPFRELRPEEKQIFQDLVDELHAQFVSDVARARQIPQPTMALLADGRVYSGQNAQRLKLIDRLGNLEDALDWAGEVAGIKSDPVPVYPKEDRITFIRKLSRTLLKDLNLSGTVTDHFGFIIN